MKNVKNFAKFFGTKQGPVLLNFGLCRHSWVDSADLAVRVVSLLVSINQFHTTTWRAWNRDQGLDYVPG